MRSYSFVLSANEPQSMDAPGDFFRIKSASAGAAMSVTVDNGRLGSLEEGDAIKYERGQFGRLTLESAVAQTVVVIAGFGTMYDDSQAVNVTSSATIAPGNTLDNGGDVSLIAGAGPGATTVIRGADASALSVIIKADVANTDTVRIGTVGVAATTGYPLEPGESLSLSVTAAIAGYNPSAIVAQNIHVLPVRKV